MLKLSEYLERFEEAGPLLTSTLKKLALTSNDLYQIEIATYKWSNSILRSTH